MDLSDILTKIQTLDDVYRMKETRMICIKYLLFLLNLTFSVRSASLSVLLKEKCRRLGGVFCFCYLEMDMMLQYVIP